MATSGQKSRTGAKSSGNRSSQRRRPHQDETGIIPVLARVVRGIENAADRGKVNAANRVRYRVVDSLPAGIVLGADRRAANFYEWKNPPLAVQAVNLPQHAAVSVQGG